MNVERKQDLIQGDCDVCSNEDDGITLERLVKDDPDIFMFKQNGYCFCFTIDPLYNWIYVNPENHVHSHEPLQQKNPLNNVVMSQNILDSIKAKYMAKHPEQIVPRPAIVRLDLSLQNLRQLPELPDGLITLLCNGNRLVQLPVLPPSLINLFCSENRLIRLPELPQNLTMLWCYQNRLLRLPELPQGLRELSCGQNRLTRLPALPQGLINLFCSKNRLIQLPALPQDLRELICFENRLIQLPDLPPNLITLYCFENFLQELPDLPQSLIYLDCSGNEGILSVKRSVLRRFPISFDRTRLNIIEDVAVI